MPYRRRSTADWTRIRELFVRRRTSYDLGEVARLLRIPETTVRNEIAGGTVTALPVGSEVRLTWEDVVVLGLAHRWTYRMLTESLRGARDAALPPLVRVAARRVALPRYQWKVLRLLAARRTSEEQREITVSDLLEEAVTTALLMNIDEWQSLEEAAPGVRAASSWPSEPIDER